MGVSLQCKSPLEIDSAKTFTVRVNHTHWVANSRYYTYRKRNDVLSVKFLTAKTVGKMTFSRSLYH